MLKADARIYKEAYDLTHRVFSLVHCDSILPFDYSVVGFDAFALLAFKMGAGSFTTKTMGRKKESKKE